MPLKPPHESDKGGTDDRKSQKSYPDDPCPLRIKTKALSEVRSPDGFVCGTGGLGNFSGEVVITHKAFTATKLVR